MGPVELDVPRERANTFEPQIVRKRQRRLTGVDEVVLSLYSKGLTKGEFSAQFASSRRFLERQFRPRPTASVRASLPSAARCPSDRGGGALRFGGVRSGR
jgi:hypothetical protein